MSRPRPLLSNLTHPVVILSIAVLAVNDHVLKQAVPSWVTGKASDVAGLVFFPLLLAALAEWGLPRVAPARVLAGAIVATGAAFAAVQLVPAAADAYSVGLGALQYPAAPTAGLRRVAVTPDATDLLALPAAAVAWWAFNRQPRRAATSAAQ